MWTLLTFAGSRPSESEGDDQDPPRKAKRAPDDERLQRIIQYVAALWLLLLITIWVLDYLFFDHTIDVSPTTIGFLLAGALAFAGVKVIPWLTR